jgi:outer membrane protein OmpA-like peptidoglycan-associated protein
MKKLKRIAAGMAVLLFAFAPYVSAQRCEEAPSKKAAKLLERGSDPKKSDIHTRIALLTQATEEDPQFASAWYALGAAYVSLASMNGTGYQAAEKYFRKAIEICPFYNAKAYFLLGKIAYGKQEYRDASGFFQMYLQHEDKKAEAEEAEALKLHPLVTFLANAYEHPVPFEPVSLQSINTYEDEFLPMLTPDNDKLFYTRRFTKQGRNELVPRQVEELTCSQQANNQFSAPFSMSAPFNSPGEGYGGVTFSVNNHLLIITICKSARGGAVNCDLYSSRWKEGKWSAFESLGDSVNTKDGWESQPTLSGDGNQLFFATAREGSRGMDIYGSRLKEDGTWSKAASVGKTINTDKNEKSPFIHSDSKTLYFSSDGHTGMGGYDLFFAKADSAGNFKRPVNLGYPINTPEDEAGFFVSLDGKRGYFSSNKLKGKGAGGWDVFGFDLYKEARPEKVLLFKGSLASENIPLSKARIEIKGIQSGKTSRIEVDSVTGEFAGVYAFEKNEDALVSFTADNAAFQVNLIKAPAEDAQPVVSLGKKELLQAEEGKSFVMENILYGVNSADLLKESKVLLDAFADYLNAHPNMKVEIRGHTDNKGNPADNLALSADRAFTVFSYLQQKGVGKNKLSFKGFGDSRPLAGNDTEEGRTRNRRTEFYIEKM